MHSNQDINSLQNRAGRKEPKILTTKVRNKDFSHELTLMDTNPKINFSCLFVFISGFISLFRALRRFSSLRVI